VVPPTPAVYSDASSKALTWTGGLDYQAAPDTLLYLMSRRGFRPGGFNTPSNGVPLPGYGPECVNDVELGVKSDWQAAGIPIHTNADIFYQKYRDIQVQVSTVDLVAGFIGTLDENAAAAKIRGAEFEALAQLTEDLQLGINANYLSFDYTQINSEADAMIDAATLNATRTTNNPPWKYGLNARYHLPLNAQVGDIALRANWSWQDTTAATLFGPADAARPSGTVPAYGLLNMAANWDRIFGGPLDASLFASNVINKTYLVQAASYYNEFGFAQGVYGAPRMYGIRFRYRFGAESKSR